MAFPCIVCGIEEGLAENYLCPRCLQGTWIQVDSDGRDMEIAVYQKEGLVKIRLSVPFIDHVSTLSRNMRAKILSEIFCVIVSEVDNAIKLYNEKMSRHRRG